MKGIEFTPDMLAAIVERRKTQTRRRARFIGSVAYKAGDVLYIKESTRIRRLLLTPLNNFPYAIVEYRDGVIESIGISENTYDRLKSRKLAASGKYKWSPARYMLGAFARYKIQVVSVRTQMLRDMSEADARAEGFDDLAGFRQKWVSLHGAYIETDWVFVIEFKLL